MQKITKRNGKWTCRVYDGMDENGKKVQKRFTAETKAEVEQMIVEYKKNRKSPSIRHLTVRMAIDRYMELSAPILSPTTMASYQKIQKFSFQKVMDVNVTELTDNMMQEAINEEATRITNKGTPISAKTVKNEWALLSSALRTICKISFIIRLPKVQHKNEQLPEPHRIMQAIKGTECELPCLLAMWCSLRMSEIRGLTCDSIHDNELWIDKVIVDVNGAPTLKTLAKTDSSIRKVQIPLYIMTLIENTDTWKNYVENGQNEPLIPMTRNQIYHYFTRRMESQGIKMSFHDLRHVFASVSLTVLGLPPKVVQNQGGWSTPDVMNRIYSQSFSEEERRANEERDQYFIRLLS